MTDYTNLKARLEDRMVCSIAQNSCRNDWMCEQALAAIEELEARVEKAKEALRAIERGDDSTDGMLGEIARATLAEQETDNDRA